MVEACANCSLLECGMIGDEYHCFPSNGMTKKLKAMIIGNYQFGHLKIYPPSIFDHIWTNAFKCFLVKIRFFL